MCSKAERKADEEGLVDEAAEPPRPAAEPLVDGLVLVVLGLVAGEASSPVRLIAVG
jgi:hypothetical protein